MKKAKNLGKLRFSVILSAKNILDPIGVLDHAFHIHLTKNRPNRDN